MARQGLLIVMAIAILNGIFSPALFTAFALHPLWYPAFLPRSLPFVLMASSLLVATFTVMIAGLPAALYERLAARGEATHLSNVIWIAAAALLTVPALENAIVAAGR
jgi:hypothetical protein